MTPLHPPLPYTLQPSPNFHTVCFKEGTHIQSADLGSRVSKGENVEHTSNWTFEFAFCLIKNQFGRLDEKPGSLTPRLDKDSLDYGERGAGGNMMRDSG